MSFRPSFDSTTLAAVTDECKILVGGRLQRISQPDRHTLALQVYCGGKQRILLMSCNAQYARAHLSSVRPTNPEPVPSFCAAARKWTENGRVTRVSMVGMDRILHVEVVGTEGRNFVFVGEFMGKHSNIMLLDKEGTILGAIKRVGPKQSTREVRPGLPYRSPPPMHGLDPMTAAMDDLLSLCCLSDATGPEWLQRNIQGVSPFLAERLWEMAGQSPGGLREAIGFWRDCLMNNRWRPVAYRVRGGPSLGAYPIPFAPPEGVICTEKRSLSEALEAHYLAVQAASAFERERATLLGVLRRVSESARRALEEVNGRLAEAEQAERLQLFGELILAYAHTLHEGADRLVAPDYTDPGGSSVEIPLSPQATPAENAERYFRKARAARQAEPALNERRAALERTIQDAHDFMARLDQMSGEDLAGLRHEASLRGWLRAQEVASPARGDERPYEGHRIRRVRTPEGVDILYGENASANDYLTQRVAKPNDWWLHVRGDTSAHAVIPTNNRPEATPVSVLRRAALLVARTSPAKHSSLVAVDYTLRKFVRKPRGSSPGAVIYSHEKTLHVSPSEDD